MIIIGERINATRSAVKAALEARDGEAIANEARQQADAGAAYLDVNGGSRPEAELENMKWLCETVQAAVSLPLCIDSANPEVIEAGLKLHRNGRPMINSITMETGKHERVLPLVKEYGAGVVALCMDDDGIPKTAAGRIGVVERLVGEAGRVGVPLSAIYVDPLVMALSADNGAGQVALQTLAGIKGRWPEINTTCGLSNISFGLPNRKLLNRTFFAMLMAAGLDSAIIDPLDPQMMAAALAGPALLGQDEYCMKYLKGYRAKKLEV